MSTNFEITPIAAAIPPFMAAPKPVSLPTSPDALQELQILAMGLLPSESDISGRAGAVLLSSADEKDFSVLLHSALFRAYSAAVNAAEADAGITSSYGNKAALTAPGVYEVWTALEAQAKEGSFFADVSDMSDYLKAALPKHWSGTNSDADIRILKSQIKTLRRSYVKRRAQAITTRATSAIESKPAEEVSDLLTMIIDSLSDLKLRLTDTSYRSMEAVTHDLSKLHIDLHAGKSMSLATGYAPLDEMLRFGGFSAGQMVVIAAPPAGAKTGMAGGFALNVAKRGQAVGFFTREMPDVDLALRMEAAFGEIPLWQISDQMSPTVFKKLQDNLPKLAALKVFFDSTSSTIDMMRAKARQMVREDGVRAIIIDYLQLVRLNGGKDLEQNRANEVAAISRQIKAMSLDLGIPVIALSQISNEGLKSGKAEGRHLKESGGILADADVVIFIDSPPVEEGFDPPALQPVQFRIAKQRNGTTGACNMIFRRSDVTFHAPKMQAGHLASKPHDSKPADAPAYSDGKDDDDGIIPF